MTSPVFSPVTKLPITKVLLDLSKVARVDCGDCVVLVTGVRHLTYALFVHFRGLVYTPPVMLVYHTEVDRGLDLAAIGLASSLGPSLFDFPMARPTALEEERELHAVEAAEAALRLFDPVVPVSLSALFEADM